MNSDSPKPEIPAGIDQAIELTLSHFKGVIDKGGQPYILHCLRVMMSGADRDFQLVGLMHDLIEDTPVTLGELRKKGFSEQVVEAVACLTHHPEVSYTDYVCQLKKNDLARRVKMADLLDNAALSRAPVRTGKEKEDISRLHKYLLSYQFLDSRISEAEYRNKMAAL
jgi:(p)ppGpp synthase/HD superfamily hydrolase